MSELLSATRPRRRWLQFSLRTALIVILLAAVGFSVWTSNERAKENNRLQADNDALRERLRNEIGELEIQEADRDKLHVIAVPAIEPMTWKWRVYVPQGRTFSLHSIIRPVSDANFPASGNSCGPIPAGEHLMVIALRKNESKQNQWQWIVRCGGIECGPVLEGENAKWIQMPSNFTANAAGQKQIVIVESGKPLEMLRYRSFPRTTTGGPLTGVGEGILVWIRDDGPRKP